MPLLQLLRNADWNTATCQKVLHPVRPSGLIHVTYRAQLALYESRVQKHNCLLVDIWLHYAQWQLGLTLCQLLGLESTNHSASQEGLTPLGKLGLIKLLTAETLRDALLVQA